MTKKKADSNTPQLTNSVNYGINSDSYLGTAFILPYVSADDIVHAIMKKHGVI